MATIPNPKHLKTQEPEDEDEALARFHRAVRDEGQSTLDIWSLPMETLGQFSFSFSALLWIRVDKTLYIYEPFPVTTFSGNPN
jgi:hypothetical protein